MTHVLITGAAGSVGRMLRTRLAHHTLRLLDVAPVEDGPEDIRTADIADMDALTDACAGVDAIVHLAGVSSEGRWEDILRINIDGTRAVLEAARTAGVSRVILASSNHAVGFQERGEGDLPADVEARPDTYYGVSKATMEALGKLYADRFGMTVTALRIGSCFPEPFNARSLATWLSPDDCGRLVEATLTTPLGGYRAVWGVSANTRRWWSLEAGKEIGYHPVDDAEVYAEKVLSGQPEPDWSTELDLVQVGGGFCRAPLGVSMR
ncbi:NAD-dependent epimerase/dehydratase family protein [Longispora fulva]|uniref:Nucleoside-diphosphate-sugar epimerase n=1 Tax=Longispora fulva TaxID=619741 RepID=A0A8J7KGW5_9ACTN|nr:NAD(P)-dependent oxidoreductase [Longispora fulva]MBG6135304.1 nucleoside-diphosphate-sugar epimerase [Longispora fulva]